MDVGIFSPKSQTLTLTTTCSSPPPLAWLSPSSSLHSIRRQFLPLRPQTPPPRRKCNNLGLLLHTRSPQFLVKASLHSPPNSVLIAVVVALATFTAFSLAYLNHFLQNRRKNSSKQVSGSESHAPRQLGSDAVDDIIENQIVRISSGESESLLMEVGGSNHVSDERIEQETTFVPDGAYLSETSVSIGADSFVSPQECPPFMLSDSGGVQPLNFATEMSELQLGKERKDVESCESSVLENDTHAEVSVPAVSSSVLTESVREEQFAYRRANQSVLKSPANLEVVKAISSHASPLNGYSLFLLKRDTELSGAELSLQEALQTAEHVEGKIPLACHKEGPSHKIKATRRGRSFPRNNERRHLMQEDDKNKLQFPYPNGKHANDPHDVSGQLHSYNHLIRQGRLSDCIDLLEDMERKGLLDVDKVYHTRFFNVCKSQKAIKEAFRFFKLVLNPTLSTFNMLMSVCASSKDSEVECEA